MPVEELVVILFHDSVKFYCQHDARIVLRYSNYMPGVRLLFMDLLLPFYTIKTVISFSTVFATNPRFLWGSSGWFHLVYISRERNLKNKISSIDTTCTIVHFEINEVVSFVCRLAIMTKENKCIRIQALFKYGSVDVQLEHLKYVSAFGLLLLHSSDKCAIYTAVMTTKLKKRRQELIPALLKMQPC